MESIGDAIRQKKFKNEYQKAAINLVYTASRLNLETNAMLKPFGLTIPQFNILRILRGMQPNPGSVKQLTERMVDHASNASRLVDKLLTKGWVERKHCPHDRRQVNVTITNEGLELLEKASTEMDQLNQLSFKNLTIAEAKQLNHLLDKL